VDLRAFPGGALVAAGIRDLAAGRLSDEALLVSIGARRLRAAGLEVGHPLGDPEHRLNERIAAREGDAAHSRYNALVRALVSFERALECAGSPTPSA
jgi:hypothetical protein